MRTQPRAGPRPPPWRSRVDRIRPARLLHLGTGAVPRRSEVTKWSLRHDLSIVWAANGGDPPASRRPGSGWRNPCTREGREGGYQPVRHLSRTSTPLAVSAAVLGHD